MTAGRRYGTTAVAWGVAVAILVPAGARPAHADWKKPFVTVACLGGAVAGVKAGEAMAAFEARRRNLSPQEAAQHKRAFQIGMGLALCGAAAGITNSVYNRLSKRGKEAREREIKAALEDAQPHAYADPDNTSLQGTVVAQPAHVEGDGECRVVEDRLAEETALVKYLPDASSRRVEAEADLTVEAGAMRRMTVRVIAATVAACALAGTAEALVFDRVSRSLSGDRAVLWIRDCGTLGDSCPGATGFSSGDSSRLRRALGEARYEEVWLWSGGGNLVEGILIGHVLREWQATVRVPAGRSCASACTVAFLGGLFRFVDPGARYAVHAATGLLHGFQGQDRQLVDVLIGGSEDDTVHALRAFVAEQLDGSPAGCAIAVGAGAVQRCGPGARGYAAALFAHFQAAVMPLGQSVDSGLVLRRWVSGGGQSMVYAPDQLRDDVARIRREGEPAAQEILMRLERESMAHAIAELEAMASSLGPRARPALKMLEVMYSKRIAGGAADVSPATLLQMGYVTQLFESDGAVMVRVLLRSVVVLVAVIAAPFVWRSLLQAQGKDTVWTRVSADGVQLTLSWDKSHPWSKEMDGRGADLVARYRTQGGREVSERLAAGKAGREDRRLTFALPDGVRSRVEGPVCLFLQVAGRRVLPVRRSERANADTAGFRYPAWDARVMARTEADLARERLAAAERALAIAEGNLARQLTAAAERHWTTLEACDAPSVRAARPLVKPYSVVGPSEQDDVARRVCVHRTYVTSQGLTNPAFQKRVQARLADLARQRDRSQARELLLEAFFGGVDVFEVAGALFDRLKASGRADATFVRDREPQAAAFLLDWQRWQPTLARYAPHLGTPSEEIGWPSTAASLRLRLGAQWLRETFGADAVWALEDLEPPTLAEEQATVGAALDAYDGCVADTRSQLATNYEEWQKLVASEPTRAASEREFLVRDCRAGVTRLTELQRERARFEAQLAEARAAAARADRPLPPLPARVAVLNFEACTP